ncbi:MAG: transposase [Acidobacteriota bacterium]
MRRESTRKGRPRQLGLPFRTWGGKRKGAGRKPRTPGRVSHRARPLLASRHPVHVTLSVDSSLPSLRRRDLALLIEACFRAGKDRQDFRLVHYSIQRRHLHLIVEAQGARSLSRGLQGLSIRVAKRLNRALGRSGRVFVDRYFGRILKNPRQVRNTLSYVLNNVRRHAARRENVRIARGWVDELSSGRWFDGWRDRRVAPPLTHAVVEPRQPSVAVPRTWLLRVGWRRYGLIAVDEVPGPELDPPRQRPRNPIRRSCP